MSTGDHKLDEFESLFRSALSDVFHYRRPALANIAVVTDVDAETTATLSVSVRNWLSGVDDASSMTIHALDRSAWAEESAAAIPTLLARLDALQPDLVVSQRALLGRTRDLPYTLGSVCDTLSQGQPKPLMLLPPKISGSEGPVERVLAVTNHLQGDDDLVSWAVTLTPRSGTLTLAHIEDDVTMERLLDAIGRIREIDSDVARQTIPAKLLELPARYIDTISEVLNEEGIHETIVPLVRMGHALTDYRDVVEQNAIDLIVVNGRDDRQRAMQGLAHALAVELRDQPVLVL